MRFPIDPEPYRQKYYKPKENKVFHILRASQLMVHAFKYASTNQPPVLLKTIIYYALALNVET